MASKKNEKDQSREEVTRALLAHYPVSSQYGEGYCRCSFEAEPMVWWTPDHVADVLGLPPGVEGRSDPTGGDGYVPGAWDEVRSAYLDGHISAAAYDALRALVIPPGTTSPQEIHGG